MTTSNAIREYREAAEAPPNRATNDRATNDRATNDRATNNDSDVDSGSFLADVLAGLSQTDKRLPCKYFYDARGSALFDRICELPEYYPTRTELALMREHAHEMAAIIPSGCVLIEYGSGSSIKTRLLLDHLDRTAGYAPVDVSREHLLMASQAIAADYPHISVHPVCADFTQPFDLPAPLASLSAEPAPEHDARDRRPARRVVYFPGSTLGNFTPPSDLALLRNIATVVGAGGAALVGLDLQKAPAILEAAYNDSQGVTADFNRNLLVRINRELGGDFDVDAFAHRAIYNRELGRIEMYLDSQVEQTVHIADQRFEFQAGEAIHTEYSCKYTLDGFASLAAQAGFSVTRSFVDPEEYFAVTHLVVG